jgi:opacity protein-like surface antigen
MSGRWLCVGVYLCAVVLTASALGQDEKNEIGGTFGHTIISDQGIKAAIPDPTIHSGKGWSFDVEYSRRFLVSPLYSLSAEVVGMFNPDEDLNAGGSQYAVVPANYKQFFVTPAARANLFPTTAISPWVSFGAGFAHFSQASTLDYGGTNPGKATTSAVMEAGLGLDVRIKRRIYVRAEVRDFWSGEPDFPLAPTGKSRQHNYFVAVGAFWRF